MQNLLVILIAVLNFFLGLLSYVRNRKNPANFYFAIVALGILLWAIGIVVHNSVIYGSNLDLFWANFVYFGVSFAIIGFFLFANFFPYGQMPKNRVHRVFLIAAAVLIFVLPFFPRAIFSDVVRGDLGKDLVLGPGYFVHMGLVFLFFTYSLGILLSKYKKSHGTTEMQLKYFFLGALLTTIFGIFFNVLLPVVGESGFNWAGPASTIFLFGFTSYAIVKHRLMDIRMVVARSVAYSILLLVLAGFYAGSVLAAQSLFFPQTTTELSFAESATRVVIAVVMVFLFQPLKRWITKATDSIFFKERYNTEDLLDELAHTVGSSIIMIEMLYKTLDLLVSQMKITRGLVVVFDDAGKILETQSVGYKKGIKIDDEEMASLAKGEVLVSDELSENSRYKKKLTKYEASVAIPLRAESGTAGVLLLGEKQSGDMYSQNDIKVFEIIGPEIAVAITNAKAYERIEKFNVTLRQEIKKATRELERKNEQLRELDKAKDEFISMASHQLRTPLTAIKGYLSMLLEGDAGEIRVSQYDFVNEAFQGSNRMVGLINDLLNVSRMETGRFFLEPKEIDLGKIVDEEVKQLAKQAKEKGLDLKVNIKGKIPKIWADETKIRQVVMNFADNAIYYTTSGSITVTLEADKKNVTYRVKDTGIGVPKSQQKNLFTKFYRADNARHVRPDGTGLGIYLAKRVLEDHDGELIFESVEGKGSTFGFKLPIDSNLKMKRVSAPTPKVHTTKPEIGELAAGMGISPSVLESTQSAGVEHPLADSQDKEDLEKSVSDTG